MQIRKIGPQPSEQFSILPNALARDERLSFRARGVMSYVNSHADGFHVNAELLSAVTTEGRDAMRTALNELIGTGHMRRVRYTDEQGRWRTRLNVYIHGDAPAIVEVAEASVTDADLEEPVPEEPVPTEPTPEKGPSENPPLETRATPDPSKGVLRAENQPLEKGGVIEDQQKTAPSASVPDAAGTTSGDPSTEVALGETAATTVPKVRDSIPVVLQRKLQDMGVTDGTLWTQAWQTVTALEWPDFAATEAERFPEEHLMLHLLAQQEQARVPSPSRWVRFYIEDRARRLAVIVGDMEREERMSETPQEREDRLNKRLPPAEWGVTPAAETGEQA